jgi:hypothetical protein
MRKGLAVLYIKKGLLFFLILFLFIIPFVLIQNERASKGVTGNIFKSFVNEQTSQQLIIPSAKEQQCMKDCVIVGCELMNNECVKGNIERCLIGCGLEGDFEDYFIEGLY